ncbi:tRNA pseudouridine synthase B [Candidatus Cyrtobacter comes]|uniref:tRNA pseudouridine synthase B n=1 Tax=Candidatus Cyrtobacter comes TaxID=675776 RepID=A0ABU5L6K1_9RICK|nr:tRNA pseudouridine(55) synthase TruB [Candidatus Cyrtobacter comes]MDZ5761677.1 tRNA pseudouridine synthase B [Candidatus Cyrtobacter comes]
MNSKEDGWLLFDKPIGMSSAKAVAVLKKRFGFRKIGHCGTLDPFASGLLIVGFGQATKLMCFAVKKDKEYVFTVDWSYGTDTLDNTGTRNSNIAGSVPSLDEIQSAIAEIGCGEMGQIPPSYSAISINGQRAYRLARSGVHVEMKERIVKLYELRILEHEGCRTVFRLRCGSGFYVRSLARDIGAIIGYPSHVCQLKRVTIGDFDLSNALTEDDIFTPNHNNFLSSYFLSCVSMVDEAIRLKVDDGVAALLKLGRVVNLPVGCCTSSRVLVVSESEDVPVAICELTHCLLKPVRGFV